MTRSNQVSEKVDEIYNWLDKQINNHGNLAGRCKACGRCCDFKSSDPEKGFDHRLFITSPETIYLAANLGVENIKPMSGTRCPYNVNGKCAIYQYRFAGCRIFCCSADKDFQSKLSESAIKKFKSICIEFQLPYRYTDLANALRDSATFAGQLGGECHIGGRAD